MSDRVRTALAFILVIAILFIWSIMSRPKPTPTPPETVTRDTVEVPTEVSEETQEIEALPQDGDTIVIDKKDITVVLSSIGGSVKTFYLKKYNIDIVPEDKYLFITNEQGISEFINFEYAVLHDSVIFTHAHEGGEIKKVYYFNHDYGFQLTTYFPETVRQTLSLNAGVSITEVKNRGEDLRHFNVYIKDEKVNNVTKKIKDTFDYTGKIDWFALRNKYFIMIVNNLAVIDTLHLRKLPKDEEKKETALGNDNNMHGDIDLAVFGCPFYMRGGGNRYGAEMIGSNKIAVSVLLLPVKYSELAQYQENYEEVTSGGLLGPISRIILFLFNLFYAIIRNYGFAIMLFAILIKGLFFPLSRQMIISQHKMQLLQPELKKIQQKYKDNPQKLNQEMMHLYKTYKVNPFSGCLPLLVQMPIFFALYQTLITSIEFRQAPFVLWITDLSMKDPYYVLPISMGVMMLIQSLITTVDPRQRFMVLFMPIFLVFIFLNFPSGLQLYWFTYNILTLVEHYITKRGGIK